MRCDERIHGQECRGTMKPGKAIAQTLTGRPDFPRGEVVTLSPGGPGRLVPCLKCEKCGHSVTTANVKVSCLPHAQEADETNSAASCGRSARP